MGLLKFSGEDEINKGTMGYINVSNYYIIMCPECDYLIDTKIIYRDGRVEIHDELIEVDRAKELAADYIQN